MSAASRYLSARDGADWMTLAAMLTLVVIVGVLVLMMANVGSPEITLLGGVVVLTAAGVLTPADALAGFSNPGMVTVAALFVVAAGLRETGAVNMFTAGLLGRPKTERRALFRLVSPVLVASSLMNNTAIVATLLPAISDWGKRIGVPASRLLMPLSFASILGGTCTLIGTSTNLVVAGLVGDLADTTPGLHRLSMFEITPLGAIVAVVGGVMLIVLGPVLLPDRAPPVAAGEDFSEYSMELIVPEGSQLAGKTIEEAGLLNLTNATLVEVVRGSTVMYAVRDDERLQADDTLVVIGDVDAMVDLQRTPGLSAAPDQVHKLRGDRQTRRIVQAVISKSNPIVGRSIRQSQFQNKYHAVVIAVARDGVRLRGRRGDLVLRAGDTLLLEAPAEFVDEHRNRTDFILTSPIEGASPPRWRKAWISGAILLTLIGVITLELMPPVTAALVAASMTVLTRCATVQEARRSLDLTVLLAIAAAFGLGRAMQTTGLDLTIAEVAISSGASSPILSLIVIYVVTTILTELVTNNAAAVLAVPIALSFATQLDVQPMGFIIAVMMAASASFLTPVGYQTNLMVLNAGGYRPMDYPRLGLPLSLVTGTVTIAVIPWMWPF